MKQSKTAIKELTAMYRAVLRHGILCNAIVLGLISMPVTVQATVVEDPVLDKPVFVIGDIALNDQHVLNGEAAFAGRRLNNVVDGKYQNVFPNYQLVARSFDMKNSDAYVGPVTLTLRELDENDAFAFNYQDSIAGKWKDINLATLYPDDLIWNASFADLKAVGFDNQHAGTISTFAHLDGNVECAHEAGALSFDNTYAVIDGATINAFNDAGTGSISVTNGSSLLFAYKDTNLLNTSTAFFTNPEDISSTGITTLNADNINISDSSLTVGDGAQVIFNASNMATLTNVTVENSQRGITNSGNMTISDSTFADNTATGALQGGAIYISGNMDIDNVSFDNNKAYEGGALFVRAEGKTVNINNSSFTNNSLTSADDVGGAITLARGIMNIDNTTFSNNNAPYSGAIFTYSAGNTLNITNSLFENNTALGAGAVQAMFNANISDTTFRGNVATTDTDGGGALFIGAVGKVVLDNVTFEDNEAESYRGGAVSTRSADIADNSAAKVDILNSTFMGNTAGTTGGALDNYMYSSRADDTAVYISGTNFDNNSADKGGAIYNHGEHDNAGNIASMKVVDSNFTDNSATTAGGAIYNMMGAGMTVSAENNDVTFSGNTANGNPNDIYNSGSLMLNTFAGKTISLLGGIDGDSEHIASNLVNINGSGNVDISNALKNQTVTHIAGELHLIGNSLSDVDLTGSTIAVNNGATINTIDSLINDYTSSITLKNGAIVKGDIDLTGVGSADTYTAENNANITYKLANALNLPDSASVGEKEISVTNSGATINADKDFRWYNSTNGLSLTSGGSGTGTVLVKGFSGGINNAVDITDESDQEIEYALTAVEETFDSDDNVIQKANFVITGNGNYEGTDNKLVLAKNLVVDNESSLSLNNIILDQKTGNEEITNHENATLNIKDSLVKVAVTNHGVLVSDPTTYTNTVTNTGTASFDGDSFNGANAVLANSGTVNLSGGTGFYNQALITGTGTINLVSGITQFNDTANTNIVNLKSGADFEGTLNGGILNTQNSHIDDVSGNISNGELYVDADLTGNGAIDNFADSTGSTIKNINILSSEYGNNEKLEINVGGAGIANDVQITGAMNYYTNVSADDNGNVVFSDKLVNTSNLYNKLGADWENGTYIKSAANYDNAADADHLTVGSALSALDETVATLNADENTSGSVANTVKTSAADADYDNSVSGLNATTIQGAIDENADAIATLNGDMNTNGSVAFMLNRAMEKNNALTLSKSMAYTDQRIDKLDKELSDGVASAVALSSVAVSNVRKGEVSVGGGYGYYNGQSAVAFGAAMGLSRNWSINAGTGVSGTNVSFRAGTNYKFKLF